MSQSSSSTIKDDSSNSSTDSSHTIRADSNTPSPIVFQASFEPGSALPLMSLHEEDSSEDVSEEDISGGDVEGFKADLPIDRERYSEEDEDDDNNTEEDQSSDDDLSLQRKDQQSSISPAIGLKGAITAEGDDHSSTYSDSQSSSESDDAHQDDPDRFDIFTPTIRTATSSKAWRQFYPDDPSDSDEDLDAERVEDILTLAEVRLRQQEEVLHSLAVDSKARRSDMLPTKSRLPQPYMRNSGGLVKPDAKALLDSKVRALAARPRVVEDSISARKTEKHKAPPGLSTHFDLPRTKLTPEMKRELQLLSMRAVLDPKRMYKRQGKFKLPEYSQVGTIVEGPTDFFSGRLTKKERSLSFVQDALKTELETGRFKRKYGEVQKRKSSGKKGFYKTLLAKRRRVK